MEYEELKKQILTKKKEQQKMQDDYLAMCNKFYADRDKMDLELKNMLIAYLVKPETNIKGKCFRFAIGNNVAYHKILDTALEDSYSNGSSDEYIRLKTLSIHFDVLNGTEIRIYNRHSFLYKELVFGENEITPEEFNAARDQALNEMKSY